MTGVTPDTARLKELAQGILNYRTGTLPQEYGQAKSEELARGTLALLSELATAREALSFYADHTNWGITNWGDGKHVEFLTINEPPWERAERGLGERRDL